MIAAPVQNATRAVWADWLELEALVAKSWVGEALARRTLGIGSDEERISKDDNEQVEEEIADGESALLIDRIADEIGFRSSALQDDYPFEVQKAPFAIRPRLGQHNPHDIYIFNLLLSAVKEQLIVKKTFGEALVHDGRVLFHVCASVAVAALLHNGRTFWLGFPRPDGTNFLTALDELCNKLGFGKPHNPMPAGLPKAAKDDQVDVVGWRPYADGRAAGLMVICQAATGANWKDKSVASHVQVFAQWFFKRPYANAWPAIAFPLLAHHELDEADDCDDYAEAQFNLMLRLNATHGAVLDRMRIVEGASDVLKRDPEEAVHSVGGYSRLGEVGAWVREALTKVGAQT